MTEKEWRYKYQGAKVGDGKLPPNLEDLPAHLLLDWRSLDAIREEQARVYALWKHGKITHSAGRAGTQMLERMIRSCELAMGSRLLDLEALVERLEAQVAMAQAPAQRPRLLS